MRILDRFCSVEEFWEQFAPWWPQQLLAAGLMMDWPGLPAGSSAGIGHIDGLRRGALCLQERVG